MKSKLPISTFIISLLFAFSNCNTQTSKPADKEAPAKSDITVQPEETGFVFSLPEVPVMIRGEEDRAIYLSKHYWDLFPFSDTTLISQPDITEQGFVDYIQLLNHIPDAEVEKSLQNTMSKAKEVVAMYHHFASLFEKYFYDPNSPFRNDEFYIPIVENLLQSGMLSETQKAVYSFQHEMILKNRVGTTATDFVYTLASGEKKRMHELETNYLILFFTNPDCPACASLTREMDSSATLHSMFTLNNSSKNMLTVLTLYPDRNIDEWRKALPNLPQKNWVNAYDDGTIITNKQLYDIKAIPTLYLLDKNKQILLKDSSLEEIEEYFMKVR